MSESAVIYLDHNATTPCASEVVQAMLPWFSEQFANPGSTLYAAGRRANAAVEKARGQVAALIGSEAREIIFCGSATESINLAILGFARAQHSARKKIVTTQVEHKAVLESCRQAQREGFEIVYLPVDESGLVTPNTLDAVLDERTLLVSIQAANNETGVLQDIPRLAELAHGAGAVFHCDASQMVGKLPIDVDDWDVDLMSFSGHKLYGPKGVGALFMRGGPSAWQIEPLIFGGGQERGLRSGTANVPIIVGFGSACELADSSLEADASRLASLRDLLEQELSTRIPGVKFNGAASPRLPGSTSILLPGVDSEALIMRCTGLALSNGSACSSGAPEPSYVLLAMGLSRTDAWSTIRIGLGRSNRLEQLEAIASLLSKEYASLLKETSLRVN